VTAPAPLAAASGAEQSADSLIGALGRFTVAPPGIAVYETDVATAAQSLRTDPANIRELAAAGLPHETDPVHGPLFDYDDLMNVGFFCGTGQTVPELGLRFLMRFAAEPEESWFKPRRWEVTVQPADRLGEGHGGPAPRVTVRVPDLTAPGVAAVAAPAGTGTLPEVTGTEFQERGYRAVVELTGARQTVRAAAARPIWREIVGALADGTVTYQTVPEPLRQTPEEAWRMGIADCVVASRLLAGRLRAAGQEARVRRGYLLGLFGSDHSWCELYEDGVYKPLDPVFAFISQTGDAAKGIAASPEFSAACFGSRFNRLLPCVSTDGQPLVQFDGRPAPYWAMVGVGARPWRG
jgi:hypothetical protein